MRGRRRVRRRARPPGPRLLSARVLTIGHSTHPLARFVELLRGAGGELVADVRRWPRSRRHPQFHDDALAAGLAEQGLGYEHLPALGGRRRPLPGTRNTGWEVEAFRGYADHLRTPEFAAGLARLEELARERVVAVMCAEGTWWRCHRRLVSDVLVARGWEVLHVMPGGATAAHELPDFAVVGDDGLPWYPGAQLSLDDGG